MNLAILEPIISLPILSLFAVSLLGSAHCGAMCGGFVFLAVEYGKGIKAIAAFHLGRLISYLIIGGLAGSLGVILNGVTIAISDLAAVTSSLFLVYLAWKAFRPVASPKSHQLGLLLFKKFQPKKLMYPLLLGVITAFLPCGWLYAFVALSLGTAKLSGGFAVMLLFWAGTLPLLTLIGLSPLVGKNQLAKLNTPRLKAVFLLLAALASIVPHRAVAVNISTTQTNNTKQNLICHGKHLAQ